jgi:hypothetical protein
MVTFDFNMSNMTRYEKLVQRKVVRYDFSGQE